MRDLFEGLEPRREEMADGAFLLRRFALSREAILLSGLDRVVEAAPFRHMTTPGGFSMSVSMTNCGTAGWVTDHTGYRYDARDPLSGKLWPIMPAGFGELATAAANAAGFARFRPDTCLVNRYDPGARLSLHQDRNERDFGHPIVSVSLGLPATFLFGGMARSDPVRRFTLRHGEVAVWGGPARLRFHGIAPLKEGSHDLGRLRINLTFRRAL